MKKDFSVSSYFIVKTFVIPLFPIFFEQLLIGLCGFSLHATKNTTAQKRQ